MPIKYPSPVIPNDVVRSTTYRLTIADWTRVPEGTQPVEVHSYFGDWQPCYYRTHAFEFSHPPTRGDALAALGKMVWAQGTLRRFLQEVLPLNPWPTPDGHHNYSQVDLRNAEGRVVGYVRVEQVDVYRNEARQFPYYFKHQQPGANRSKPFRDWIDANEDYIREEIVLRGLTSSCDEEKIHRLVSQLYNASRKPARRIKPSPVA